MYSKTSKWIAFKIDEGHHKNEYFIKNHKTHTLCTLMLELLISVFRWKWKEILFYTLFTCKSQSFTKYNEPQILNMYFNDDNKTKERKKNISVDTINHM